MTTKLRWVFRASAHNLMMGRDTLLSVFLSRSSGKWRLHLTDGEGLEGGTYRDLRAKSLDAVKREAIKLWQERMLKQHTRLEKQMRAAVRFVEAS
jgi:hypothetical protein